MNTYISIWLYHSNLCESLGLPLNMDNHTKVSVNVKSNVKY